MSDEQVINQENTQERSVNEGGHEEDFAQLFEQSTQSVKRLDPGQRVTTRVAGISGDFVISTWAERAKELSTRRSSSTRKGR